MNNSYFSLPFDVGEPFLSEVEGVTIGERCRTTTILLFLKLLG